MADVTPVHRKIQDLKNLTIYQLVYYLIFQKFLKGTYIDKFQNILKLCYQDFNIVSEKGIAPKISGVPGGRGTWGVDAPPSECLLPFFRMLSALALLIVPL